MSVRGQGCYSTGRAQSGPLLPGTPAGLLRVGQDLLCVCQVDWVNLSGISHGLLPGKCVTWCGQWDKSFLTVSCPSLEKGTSASHAEMCKSLSLGTYVGFEQNFSV